MSGQSVSVTVAAPWTVLDDKVVLAEKFQPSGVLRDRLWSLLKPAEHGMIRSDNELPAQKILAKVLGEVDDRNEFFAGHIPVDLASTQWSSGISYDSFVTVLDL